MRQTKTRFRRARDVVEPVTIDHGELARPAFLHFGTRRHKAGLNLGRCFALGRFVWKDHVPVTVVTQ